MRYNINALIGQEYGSIYTVNNKSRCLEFVEKFDELFDFKSSIDELKVEEIDKDNRSILDDNKSQKLTTSEINNFKEDGLTTKEIIETIVENSATFNLKTVYSQEKYLKKKQEKYSNYLRVYKPNATLLCDMWVNQGAYKTANIRIDSLAQMLNLCNVRSGCKYMVVDNFFGLVSAAILERLIGDCTVFDQLECGTFDDVGRCVQVITGEGPVNSWRQAIEALNFKEQHLNHCLLSVQIHKTIPLLVGSGSADQTSETANTTEADADNTNEQATESNRPPRRSKKCSDWQERGDELENEFRKNKRIKFEERNLRKQKRTAESTIALELLSKRNFDGLIVVLRNQNASELVDHLLNFLIPSGQFIVFSEFLEPLTQCYSDLRQKACNIKLSESWMRNFQILPMRSRPEIDMGGKSGFILHGVKLCLDD